MKMTPSEPMAVWLALNLLNSIYLWTQFSVSLNLYRNGTPHSWRQATA